MTIIIVVIIVTIVIAQVTINTMIVIPEAAARCGQRSSRGSAKKAGKRDKRGGPALR